MFKQKQKKDNAEKKRSLVSYYHRDSKVSEQYRKIYTNMKFSAPDQENHTIILTSPGYKEGKSTTAMNLGISIAQFGNKVLLIDADLKKPRLHELLQIENNKGLSTVLQGKSSLEMTINKTGMGTLDILTSGPPTANPAKLLDSTAMKKLLEFAKKLYDIVLIDTPPVLEVTDANILGNECDGALLVAKSGITKVDNIKETKRLLDLSRIKLIGSILNGHGK